MTSTINEPVVGIEEGTVAALRHKAREAAADYLAQGYANREAWNRFLVRVGLEPFTARRVTAKVTLTHTKGFDVPEAYRDDVQGWIRQVQENSGGARGWFSYYDFDGVLGEAEPEVAVDEEYVPGVEGVEPDPDAATDDLRTYKRLLRREGLKLRKEFEWCEGGTSDAFERVGLARLGTIRVPVEVTTRRVVMVSVDDAEDEEEAREVVVNDPERVKGYVGTVEVVGVSAPTPGAPFVGGNLAVIGEQAREYPDNCRSRHDGWTCSREREHADQYGHIAAYHDGEIGHMWPVA